MHPHTFPEIDFSSGLDNHTAMQRWFSHTLSALLLVVCQTALLVHQSDIDAHSHGENCTVCLLVHGLDNALPMHFAALPVKPAAPVVVTEKPCGHTQQTPAVYRARAPPAVIHPVV